MPQVTKANPAPITRGTLYSTLQLKGFKITHDAITETDGLYSKATSLAQEFGTTGAMFQVKSDGASMIVIGDGHALDEDIVAIRADKVLGGTGVLTNTAADNSGTATTALVSVRQLSSLYGQ